MPRRSKSVALSAMSRRGVVIAGPEEEILEAQIRHLRNVAVERLLTLDETRQLDLLIKNLLLLRGDPTTIHGESKPADGVSDADLVNIVTNTEPVIGLPASIEKVESEDTSDESE